MLGGILILPSILRLYQKGFPCNRVRWKILIPVQAALFKKQAAEPGNSGFRRFACRL
jgi:hypothetical protein